MEAFGERCKGEGNVEGYGSERMENVEERCLGARTVLCWWGCEGVKEEVSLKSLEGIDGA